MRGVVVPRPPGKGEAAGHGQWSGRVVEREPELGGRHLDRGGETRVEVDRRDVIEREAGQVEGSASCVPDGRSPVEPPTSSDRGRVLGLASRAGEATLTRGYGVPLRRARKSDESGKRVSVRVD